MTILTEEQKQRFRELRGEYREQVLSYWRWWLDYHKNEKGVVDREAKIALAKEVLKILKER